MAQAGGGGSARRSRVRVRYARLLRRSRPAPVPLLAAAWLAGAVLGPGPAAAVEHQGPFGVRTQNPLHLLYLGARPVRAATLAPGVGTLSFEASVTNLVERTPITGGWELDLDLELWRFAAVARAGVAPGVDVGVELPLLRFDGGVLDRVVDGWHAALGVSGGRRESLPVDRFSYRVAPGLVERLDAAPVPLGIGDVTVDARFRLIEGGASPRRPSLALQVAGKLPTGGWERGLGSGAPDLGGWALFEVGGRVLALHASLGVVVQGPVRLFADLQVPAVATWMLAGELHPLRGLSLVVEVVGATPRLHGLLASNETGVTLDLAVGLRGAACGTTWQVVFVEDLVVLGPSVDFSVLASVGQRFGPSAPAEPRASRRGGAARCGGGDSARHR